MALKRPRGSQGTLITIEHSSRVLAGNALGDPHVRRFPVWLPSQYHQGATHGRGKRFPVLYDFVGYTGSGPAHANWRGFDENVPERAARLLHEKKIGPCILVFPDCYTALGGNQSVNSSAIGNYADYLIDEIVPYIDADFRTLATREHRGCFGKSSGGYGAIVHGMKYARHWGAVADHSGDAYFDFVYRNEWPATLDELSKYSKPKRKAGPIDVARLTRASGDGVDDGRVKRFLKTVWKKEKLGGSEINALMMLCMAATYDPDPEAPNGFRLPLDLETGEFFTARWQRWLKQDPINLVARYVANLESLKGVYIDCGWRDQYHIHYGARILSQRLAAHGINHVYEEFDDTHSSIDYRMERSLPFLYKALKP